MRIRRITLQNFRNIALAELEFRGRQQFFAGANGQGKTNLLEAVGFITALRSFRTTDTKLLIAHGESEAALACELEHERLGDSRIVVKWRPGGKEVTCDGERVTRLGEYLGRFPTVVFSSQDQQLVRGVPALRRRWLDLTLASMDASYMQALQTYHRALEERNSLLKRDKPAVEIHSFEHLLAASAGELSVKRGAGIAALNDHTRAAYGALAGDGEQAELIYEPNATAISAEEWQALFEKNRARDLLMKTTLVGPHRDDCALKLDGRAVRDFGSEGQQRSFVLALRLAQTAFFRIHSGVQPVLLTDDVLNELDPERRRRFWAGLGTDRQVIATGTELPDGELGAWQVFNVVNGAFAESQVPGSASAP
jgi:DNA replication and repair protein RecF